MQTKCHLDVIRRPNGFAVAAARPSPQETTTGSGRVEKLGEIFAMALGD
jgi:hypothetical protein